MRGTDVIRIQQGRGRSFVGGTGIGCLRKSCGTQDEECWNHTDRRHSGPSLSRNHLGRSSCEPDFYSVCLTCPLVATTLGTVSCKLLTKLLGDATQFVDSLYNLSAGRKFEMKLAVGLFVMAQFVLARAIGCSRYTSRRIVDPG